MTFVAGTTRWMNEARAYFKCGTILVVIALVAEVCIAVTCKPGTGAVNKFLCEDGGIEYIICATLVLGAVLSLLWLLAWSYRDSDCIKAEGNGGVEQEKHSRGSQRQDESPSYFATAFSSNDLSYEVLDCGACSDTPYLQRAGLDSRRRH